MTLKKLNDEKMESIVDGAKKRDKSKVQIIVDNFQRLIKSNYDGVINENVNIEWEDYMQECNMKIIECIYISKRENYGQLCSLIEKSIKNKTVDFSKKSKRFDNLNILYGSNIDLYNLKNINERCEFEGTLISNITLSESYNILIKDKLSKEENRVFRHVIRGKSLEDYSKEKGVKLESVKRTFRRALNKIKKIKELKQFHCISLLIFAIIQDIGSFIDIFINL
ncbi:hypothetical protein [Clostridium sp. OS1-26]|uniref:hypothetical protein n=1 Tax=Clostridium sp. OS1-26 TaxID=3070681 RepID=UPI0027E201B4|nr:hypothetical protein [Clostridium sp. OS1-26]WML32642.1 hypothetical protein RCG18_14795 [Clostridium sp. OS1-26]